VPQGRRVVAVQLADHLHHLVPAELLQLLHAAILPTEYLKFAFEYPAIALCERLGIRVRRAFRRPSQKQLAQLSVQCIAVFQLRKSERDGEIGDYLRHACFTVCGLLDTAVRGTATGCMISHIMAPSPRHRWCGACLLGALLGGSPAGAAPVAAPVDTVLPEAVEPGSAAPLGSDALLFASPTTRDHIGRVVVPVMVNGRGPFRFIVDTGANHSTISPRLARELGLKPSEEASIILDGITGTAQVSFVTIDRLQAGDLTIGSTDLPVVWAPVMAGADGILGAAGLTEKSLLIDFQRNQVAISHGVKAEVRANSTRIHGLRSVPGLITLATRVGGVPVLAVIDTGAERTLGNLALRDALRARRLHGVMATMTSVYGATKEVEVGEILVAPPIVIDALRINDVAIVFGEFHIFNVWKIQDQPAMIIGMDVLGTVASLSIDFKNQDVYIVGAQGRPDMLSVMRGMIGDSAVRK
jgi:Aspartyl protease